MIIKGNVELFYISNDTEISVKTLKAGDSFGEMAFF